MMMGPLAAIGVELPHYPNKVANLGRPQLLGRSRADGT